MEIAWLSLNSRIPWSPPLFSPVTLGKQKHMMQLQCVTPSIPSFNVIQTSSMGHELCMVGIALWLFYKSITFWRAWPSWLACYKVDCTRHHPVAFLWGGKPYLLQEHTHPLCHQNRLWLKEQRTEEGYQNVYSLVYSTPSAKEVDRFWL